MELKPKYITACGRWKALVISMLFAGLAILIRLQFYTKTNLVVG